MRIRFIGASVIATLAISLVGGAALAAPRDYEENEFTFVGVEPHEFGEGSFSIGGGPNDMTIGWDLYNSPSGHLGCSIFNVTPTRFVDDGASVLVVLAGTAGCSILQDDGSWEPAPSVDALVTATWSYDANVERSTTRDNGRLCKEVSRVDYSVSVALRVVADSETVIDGDFGPVGTYENDKERCQTIGQPG